MNKKIQKIDDNYDLSTKVKNWVEKQGYSLEMRVAKKFQEHGFIVSQFEHFIDQESKDVRPVDIVASMSTNVETTTIAVKIYIECKYSAKDKPWVIVATSDKFDKFAFFSRVLKGAHPSNWKSIDTLQGRGAGRIIQSVESGNSLYHFAIGHSGYVVKESMTDQKDHAYEAIIQISKSVEAHDVEIEQIYKRTIESLDETKPSPPVSNFGLFLSIAIPVVVINGYLFKGYLESNGEIEVSEIGSGMVLVPYRRRESNPSNQITLSPVTVVTEKYLENYVSSIKLGIVSILNQTDAIKDIIEFERSKFVNQLPDDFGF